MQLPARARAVQGERDPSGTLRGELHRGRAQHGQHQCGVTRSPGDRAGGAHAAPQLLGAAGQREHTDPGLEADEPAVGRGDADRPTAVGAECQGRHPTGHRRSTSGFDRFVEPELRHPGLADHNGSRRAQPLDQLVVAAHGGARRGGGTVPGRVARDVDVVLDRHRHAREWEGEPVRSGVDAAGLGDDTPRVADLERADRRVAGGDAGEMRLRDLDRAAATVVYALHDLGRSERGQVEGVHPTTMALIRRFREPTRRADQG